MFIIKYYLSAAIILMIAAFVATSWYFSVLLLWISISLALVSLAYLFDTPSIFRKREDGSIPFYIKWLFFPFFIGAQAYNAWARRNDSVPAIQKIAPNLYLASRLFPSDIAYLKQQGIGAILDATSEFDGLNWSAQDNDLAYLNIPVLDHKSPHKLDIKKAVNWISHHINNDKGVVVHCAMGRGRSVLIVAAYLLASKSFDTLDKALAFINQSRSTAKLNKVQYKKLAEIHQSGFLQEKDSILLIANPVAGGGSWQEHREQVEQALSTKYALVIETTTKSYSAKTIAEENKDKDFKMIIACGGDGTVNEVAHALVGSEMCLGILPLGTTNALSHVLFGSQVKFRPIETACEVILSGKSSKIDTAICNQETMVLVAGLGFEQRMITMANRENKDESGEFAYIQALGKAFQQNKTQTYRVSVDGGEHKVIDSSSIVIANAAPFTTILAQGGEEPDPRDGRLDMTVLNTQDNLVLPLASLGLKSLAKSWQKDNKVDGIEHNKIREVLIENDEPLDYVIDGEVRKSKRIHIVVNPSSLCVLHAL